MLDVSKTFCWSDSKIALCWIKGKEKCWKPWVENRVVKIRDSVDRDHWFHVKGEINPADFPTRSFELFKEDWINGPKFLLSERITYKDFQTNKPFSEDAKKEERKSVVEIKTLSSIVENRNMVSLFNIVDIGRCSSLKKLIRIVGYEYRFVNNLKCRINNKEVNKDEILSVAECENALKKIILADQLETKKMSNFHKLENSLKLFQDDNGILRLRGRFSNSNLRYNKMYPAFIRSNGRSAYLIIFDAHERCLHHGVETTLSYVRENYWTIQGQALRRVRENLY